MEASQTDPSDQGAETPPSPYPTSEDQQAAHDQREQEREQLRREHNERTGGGEVQEGEVQAQREEHNARTAGLHDGVDGSQDQ